MFNPTRTALYVAIGAMALAAGEANAGCKLVSGTKVCAAWIPGSEICQVSIDSGTNLASNVHVSCTVEGADQYGCPTGQLPPGTLACGTPPVLLAATNGQSGIKAAAEAAEAGQGRRCV